MSSEHKESNTLIEDDYGNEEVEEECQTNYVMDNSSDIAVNRSCFDIFCDSMSNFWNDWCPTIFVVICIIGIIVALFARKRKE